MRICFYGGAGLGKTATAEHMSSYLRRQKRSVELVQEEIKLLAYEKRRLVGLDPFNIFWRQLRREELLLRHVKYIVTDSPLYLQCFYMKKSESRFFNEAISILKQFDELYPSINVFLSREGIPYEPNGRFESEDEANRNDDLMRTFLVEQGVHFAVIPTVNKDQIETYIAAQL